jgi:hypothetical protein
MVAAAAVVAALDILGQRWRREVYWFGRDTSMVPASSRFDCEDHLMPWRCIYPSYRISHSIRCLCHHTL